MDLVLSIFLYLTIFLLASFKRFRPEGWALAWGFLFFLSGIGRLWVFFDPTHASIFLQGILLFSPLILLGIKSIRLSLKQSLSKVSWLPVVLGIFLFYRNFFPQFDVDSLNYHLTGLLWRIRHGELMEFQQHSQVYSLWIHWLGFEEFLLIPGATLGAQLAVWGGIIGGVFKFLTVMSVLSCIPRNAIFLRTLAAVALMIDDHFFFSGINRFVYISPALIGLSGLAFWFVWRTIRGHLPSFWISIALGLGAASVKYHGIYFFIAIVALSGLGAAWHIVRARDLKRLLHIQLSQASLFFLGVFQCGVIHLMRIVETGSPTPPYALGPFRSFIPYRGLERIEDMLFKSTIWDTISSPKEAMMFPAIYINKAVMWMFLPALVILVLSFLFRRISRQLGIQQRELIFATFGFGLTVIWALLAIYIRNDETRYPRYVVAVGAIALAYWIFTFRKVPIVILKRFPDFIGIPTIKLWRSKVLGTLCSIALLAFFFVKIDTRANNVTISERAGYNHINKFIGSYFSENLQHPDPSAPYMEGLLIPINHRSIPKIAQCLKNLASKEGDPSLALGNRIFTFGPNSVWSSYLVAPLSALGSISEGGGYLQLPEKSDGLVERGFRYALVPKNSTLWEGIIVKVGHALESRKVKFVHPNKESPVCDSEDMILVKLEN